jgi:hypothetical protein
MTEECSVRYEREYRPLTTSAEGCAKAGDLSWRRRGVRWRKRRRGVVQWRNLVSLYHGMIYIYVLEVSKMILEDDEGKMR